MPSLLQTQSGLEAICNFDADAAAAAFRSQRGFASFVRNGAGDYTFTLSRGIAQEQFVAHCTLNSGAAGMADVAWVTATTCRVKTLDSAAMAADKDFMLTIAEIGPT